MWTVGNYEQYKTEPPIASMLFADVINYKHWALV
jgi:hypothetical protein